MTGHTETDVNLAEPDKWEKRFFPNAQLTRIEIELFEQDMSEMRDYLKQGTFENENEGWRYLLGTGYAYLRGKERLLLPDGSGVDLEGLAENLRRQIEIETMYAVLKQRAYVWMKDYQTMDMQSGALHTMVSGYRALSDRLREENAALKAEVARLQEQLAHGAPEAEVPVTAPSPPVTPTPEPWWKRSLKRTG